MGVRSEDFAENRAAELAFHILVEVQRDNILDAQRRTTDRVLVELSDVW